MQEERPLPEKRAIAKKVYTITVEHYDDGSSNMQRVNDGFSPLELLGLSAFIGQEVKDQIMGRIVPDQIKRQVIVD